MPLVACLGIQTLAAIIVLVPRLAMVRSQS